VTKTPNQQKYLGAQKRSRQAKMLVNREKEAVERSDAFYRQVSTDQSVNYDRKEINSYLACD